MQTTRRTLHDGWRVREVILADTAPHNALPWLPAQVPGHVHLDLMRAGVIPDPFARMHERDVAWIDDSDWIYETTFAVEDPAPVMAFLKFHGLDTIAEIILNGEEVGRTDNMYVPHEFSVGGMLQAGENHLQVTFRSAQRTGLQRQQQWNAGHDPIPLHWDSFAPRSLVRKAQYMYGWDRGPVLLGCGLWQPVELITVPAGRIHDWKYDVEFLGPDKAIVTVTAEIERTLEKPMSFCVEIAESHLQKCVEVPAGTGRKTVTATITIDQPRRWQPNGMHSDTEASRYTIAMHLHLEGFPEPLDSKTARIGLRTIELVREPDADGQGEGFKFRVNGQDLFIKGANWIPNDSFPARSAEQCPDAVRERITQARDAGMNMLRIWGGGFYGTEQFYDICDELGLLVWQDFPYACAYYPDTGDYADAARVEALAAVRRIRNHPSLALWCGNNENSMMFHGNWHGARPPRHIGDRLYTEILPEVVAAEDPKTPYWPSSPFGGDDPNAVSHGDCHNWDVWHGRGDWVHYTQNDSRFCSEFGFASSCGLAAWETVLADSDKHPLSPVVRWHDKTRKGYDTYLGLIGLHFPASQTMEDLVFYSQLNQAEALKFGIEHYRRRKGRCWGTLFWQLNDCWPVQSWAIIDSLGEQKAAFYAARKFYAPLLVSLVRDDAEVAIHLVNDLTHAVPGTLTCKLSLFNGGEPLAEETYDVQAGPNSAQTVAVFPLTPAQGRERSCFVDVQFQPSTGDQMVENLLFLAEPKDLALADPGLAVSVSRDDAGCFVVSVTAQRLAPYVWLRRTDTVPLKTEDNFFHLGPGCTREIVVTAEDIETAEQLRGLLVTRTL